MIILYELHWSYYCEKIRWALDYKKMNWKKVNINAFTKQEMKKYSALQSRYLVPFIYDEKTKSAVTDSSPILQYLEETYPSAPSLFSQDKNAREEIYKYLPALDSKLGVIVRRLGYTQIILENPTILSRLFLSSIWYGFFNWPGIRRVSSAILAMILIKRFRLDLNESLNLYESLEKYLLEIVGKLSTHHFLINNTFTAADLSLAVYLRPLLIVPFFKEHPKLTPLFEWQQNLFKEHQREEKLLYEKLIEENRKKYYPVRRKIRHEVNTTDFLEQVEKEVNKNQIAFNDQEPIWTWEILKMPYYYFFKIKQNIVRKKLACDNFR